MPTMDELLCEQKTILEQIKSIQSNFKKDGPSRKHPESINKRLGELDELWKQFDQNHNLLNVTEGEKTGEYFETDVYRRLKDLYSSTRSMISSYKPKVEQVRVEKVLPVPPEKPVDFSFETTETVSSDSKISDLFNEQNSNIRAFERAIENLNINQLIEKWQLEDKLKTITSRWENYDRLYWKLDNITKHTDAYERDYDRLERLYEEAKTLINTKIWSQTHQQKSAPKMELPFFSGSFSQWTTFKDLFTETVHLNSFISNAQKMQHLKSKLRGEAEKLVQHLNISSENYETCWSILQQRYDNIRLLFSYHANILLNQPAIQQPTSSQFKKMHDTTRECLNAITNLHIDTRTWDPLLVHILLQKLDSETAQSFIESLKSPREIPSLVSLLQYLENKFMSLETTTKPNRSVIQEKSFFKQQSPNYSNAQNRKFIFPKQKMTNFIQSKTYVNCPKCNQQHGLYNCKDFLALTSNERLATVRKLNVCINCLFSHNGNECISTKRCKHCNKNHSTLLHEAMCNDQSTTSKPGHRLSSHVGHDDEDEVLLATAQIQVKSANGTYLNFRVLIDQGSQVNLITQRAAQQLNLKRTKLDAVISGIGAIPNNKCKGSIQLTCKALYSDFKFSTEALIMNNLTRKLPNKTFNKNKFEQFQHLQLADPEFNVSGNIDILLGADIYSEIIMDGLIKNKQSTLIAQQTHLGWIVCGKYKSLQCHVIIKNLEDFAKFWEQEEIQNNNEQTNIEHDTCETFYKQTTTRLEDGRYQVRLPMKPEMNELLGESKSTAVAQFKQLERKMSKNQKFAEDYRKFMEEYEDLGHMKVSCNTTNMEYFLPHHGVVRQEAVTTKHRVVFNASQKTSTKHSLNDLMEAGPNLQSDLQKLLIQWRQYRFVYCADIEKMYRFIAMHPEDQPLQKIVWRNCISDPMKEYQLCTVTYGTKAAPYLALRTLKQLAFDEGDKYPEAKQILLNNFFVDDALFGKDTINEARSTRDQLIKLLGEAAFNLRKWSSNELKLVEDLPENMRNPKNFDFSESETNKTLGLGWNPKTDEFVFSSKLKQTPTQIPTKRIVLSEISTLYDPLGWLSPITVKTKILFQQVWKSSTGWDEKIPNEIEKEWLALRNELTSMEQFKIIRWLGTYANKDCQLHAFCDASEKAYACVVYCTVRDSNGKAQTTIIAAKTKVAPLKKAQSLPRLELCGAVLLTKLIEKIKHCLYQQNIKITAWTDSMVVLGWLNGELSRWKPYVANRVREIISILPAKHWRHIRSNQNPADCASRGLLPSQLAKHVLWWEGPTFLKNERELNKNNEVTAQMITTNIEAKVHTITVEKRDTNCISQLLEKHSSITKIAGITAWVSRFINNARSPPLNRNKNKYLTLMEIQNAYSTITKITQNEYFKQEIQDIKKKGHVSCNSKILKLNPLLDKNNILRANGRLFNSDLPETAKSPVILPKNSNLTRLLIDQTHKTTLHGGARLTLAKLRERYWVLGGNKTVKSHLRQCVKCRRFQTNNQEQLMGNLPTARVTPSRPFYHTGVDFTGHVDIKINKGRGVKTCKGYIAIFICMVTKAVHLELVSDLTSQTFILALKRMASRRGVPKHMYSDNGTNFVGADRELRKQLIAYQTFNSEDVNREINNLEIEWHFNAPSWPNAGGLWEAAVKSMKHHLKRVLGEQKLTYEEFTTLLTQIEACLNSRPLGPLTEDVEDLDYLTPGHFLIGAPLLSIPHENLEDAHIGIRNRWQLTQKMHQDFWKRWSSEYLQLLQTRSKWNKQTENMSVGDIVVIKQDNLAPNKWALGRVTEVHPGQDDLVRVVTLKTQDGTLKRPINKIVKLPVTKQTNLLEQTDSNSKHKKDLTMQKTEPAKQNNGQTKNTSKGKTKNSLLCVFMTLLTLFQPSKQSVVESSVTMTTLDQNKPIFFDEIGKLQNIHDTWKIVTYYNMTTYWQGIENSEKLIKHIDYRCEQFAYRTICESIMTELKQQLNEIKHNNYLLKTQHGIISSRFKRGLVNGVGYLANSLFGVLDERFAEKYRQDIEIVQQNENHLLSLIKNQTSIIEAHNNILKRNEEAMSKQFQLINHHLNITDAYLQELSTNMKHEENMIYFNIMATSANIIVTKIQHIQQMLLDTATNIHHGQVDTRLMPQEQLLQELNIISGQIPKHLSIPVDHIRENLVDIYKLLQVKSRVINNFFIIEISLPLTSDNQFTLYKVIPIPVWKNNRSLSVKTSSEYIAINLRKEIYLTLTERNVDQCLKINHKNLLCELSNPTLNMRSNNIPCEINLITNTSHNQCGYTEGRCIDKWIKLQASNTWLYYCCDNCQFKIICQNHMTSKSAHLAGIISVGQGCIIKHGEATFYTHWLYQNNINIDPNIQVPTDDLSEINKITSDIYLPSLQTPPETNQLEKLNILHEKIKKIEENSVLQNIATTHDIHQYIVSYTSLGMVLVAVCAAGCIYVHFKRRRRDHRTTARHRTEYRSSTGASRTEHIEMTPMINKKPKRAIQQEHPIHATPMFNLD